jgi:NitT/TauT family transport system ATP-binding protein
VAAVSVSGLTKRYGPLTVFENLTLELQDRKVTVLLGPSGSGKTTLLDILAGTLEPDTGTVDLPEDPTVSYIFQEPRLLPWKTVRGNIEFVLRGLYDRREIRARSETFIDLVGLSRFSGYYPDQLSGGMKQRVAIARAFAYPGKLLLMDEPFKGLDLALRLSLIRAFESLWAADPRTTVFVTHDIQEALLAADEIVVFSPLPARVVKRLPVPVPKSERSLERPKLLELERTLYRLFLHSEESPF